MLAFRAVCGTNLSGIGKAMLIYANGYDDRFPQTAGNTFAHRGEGQNVLFVDDHVTFQKRPYCGVKKDNIYTSWDGSDIKRGRPPTLTSQPADRLDSLLVNDPPAEGEK